MRPLFFSKRISPHWGFVVACVGKRGHTMGTMKPTDPVAALAMALAVMTPVERLKAETVILTNAIAHVETGCDYKAVGDKGAAVGAWQMHTVAWITANQYRKANGMPTLSRAQWKNKNVQTAMAFSYVSWCREELVKAGKSKPTPQEIYIMFAWGYSNFKDAGFDWQKAPQAKRDAAERVNNIYTELLK